MPRILISGTEGKMDNYVRAVEACGAAADARYAPMPSPDGRSVTGTDADGYDGLILAGGGDISPALYGGQNTGLCRGMDPVREASDRAMVTAFWRAEKPILGICRGMQTLNVLFGGTLTEDLGLRNEIHNGTEEGDRYHEVAAAEDGLLRRLFGPRFRVNSCHHQAVCCPAEPFRITCYAPDGTPEAIEHNECPIFAVQWHPERYEGGALLIKQFIHICK